MVSIENRNKPTVALVNKGFLHDAMSAASSKGMPGIRIVAESIPSECVIEEQLDIGIEAELENIIAALTKPLTAEEKTPKAKDGRETIANRVYRKSEGSKPVLLSERLDGTVSRGAANRRRNSRDAYRNGFTSFYSLAKVRHVKEKPQLKR